MSSTGTHRPVPALTHATSKKKGHLSGGITTVNDNVGAGGVGAGVRSEVDICTLELGGLCVTAERDHAVPQFLNVLGNKVGETGVDVAGGDGVDSGKVAPLVGERTGEMDAAGFGDVVAGLKGEKRELAVDHGGESVSQEQ